MIENAARRLIHFVPWWLRSHVKRLPLFGPLQRRLVSTLLNGQEFEHLVDSGPARGVRFVIRMPEDKGIWTGTYEREFAAVVAATMQARRGAAAYDIGGWHGFFAGVLAANGASVVHVFEPLPANQLRIQRLIQFNPEFRVTLHPVAIGDVDGETELMVMPQTSMAKLSTSSFQADISPVERLKVTVRRLDSLLDERAAPPPGIIKMDIEGAEVTALAGAKELLARHRPALFVEMHSSALMRACAEILTPIGYSLKTLDPGQDWASQHDVYQVVAT